MSVAAVFSASLLGLGLAYCVCTLLIPTVGLEVSNALLSADNRSGPICASGSSSTSTQIARTDE